MATDKDNRLARLPGILPFLISAAILDVIGYLIMQSSPHPISNLTGALVVVCVGSGAVISVMPFLFDAKAALRSEELDTLAITASQFKDVNRVVDKITAATAQWMTVQEHSERAVEAAQSVSKEMIGEAKRFSEFMAQSNDREKAALRLESDKLKRSEGEWLQVVVLMLDHTFALYQAAVRSGQENVANQLTQFQNVCRDTARRMGLVAMLAEPDGAFDTERHQWANGEGEPPVGSVVRQTVAVGYSFQGRLIRKIIVELDTDAASFGGGTSGSIGQTTEAESGPGPSDELPLA
ncbi:MAG: hypothetical protein ISQ14_11850 [Verrucomicrobiae bacterium]|nr:hypothetical protein [Verrucomicrobiae bacterium]